MWGHRILDFNGSFHHQQFFFCPIQSHCIAPAAPWAFQMDLCLSWPHWFVRHLKSIFHFYNFKNWKNLINCCANMLFVVSTIILSFKILSSLTSCVDPKSSSLRCPVGIARPLPRDSIWSPASLHNQTLAFGDWVPDEIKPKKAVQHIQHISNVR